MDREMTDVELEAVTGGTDHGGSGGVRGFTSEELDAVSGGADHGGSGGVRG